MLGELNALSKYMLFLKKVLTIYSEVFFFLKNVLLTLASNSFFIPELVFFFNFFIIV